MSLNTINNESEYKTKVWVFLGKGKGCRKLHDQSKLHSFGWVGVIFTKH